jgi:CarD family transcriptional regulator
MVVKKTTKKKPAAKPVAKAKAKPIVKTQVKQKVAVKSKPVAKASKPAAKLVAAKPQVKVAIKPSAHKAAVAMQHSAKAAVHKAAIHKAAVHKAPAAAKPVASAPVAGKSAAPTVPKAPSFKVGELVVYPAHGVGRVSSIETQDIAGTTLELYIVDFEKEKLRLKVPTNRAEQKGMRHLADRAMIEQAMKVIRGRARIKRVMWSRRAQEYDAKINSGDMIAVAEVVRDLYRSERQPEQSYSERQLFEQALARFARELAAVRKIDDDQCIKEVEDFLARNAKRSAAEKSTEEDTAEEAA